MIMRRERWWVLGSLLIVTGVMGNRPLKGDDEVKQMITDLEAKATAVKCYRADMTITIQTMGKEETIQGKILFKKPRGQYLMMLIL